MNSEIEKLRSEYSGRKRMLKNLPVNSELVLIRRTNLEDTIAFRPNSWVIPNLNYGDTVIKVHNHHGMILCRTASQHQLKISKEYLSTVAWECAKKLVGA